MGVVTVQCFSSVATETHVQVSYEYIALSDKGRHFIKGFSEEVYADFIGEWRDLLLIYFASAG